MTVNVLSATQQEFCGDIFTKYHGERYYSGYSQGVRTRLHRAVWAYFNGPIPKDHHIHHINHDPNDNRPENLEAKHKTEHLGDHMTPERRLWASKNIVEKAMPAAKEWHKSVSGIEWHKANGRSAYAKRKPIERECAHCHNPFTTLQYASSARFCHQNCKMKARRRRLAGLPEDSKSLPSVL